jgi:hypothetical protein
VVESLLSKHKTLSSKTSTAKKKKKKKSSSLCLSILICRVKIMFLVFLIGDFVPCFFNRRFCSPRPTSPCGFHQLEPRAYPSEGPPAQCHYVLGPLILLYMTFAYYQWASESFLSALFSTDSKTGQSTCPEPLPSHCRCCPGDVVREAVCHPAVF